MKKISEKIFHDLATCYLGPEGKYRDGFPVEALRIIRDHKLFKLFLPEHLGGAGLSLKETLDVIQRCAYINGTLGWLVQIGNGGNYFAAYIGEDTTRELFSPADAVLAGSGAVTGTATPAEGGYTVSGTWKYASGSSYASFFTISCKVEGSDQIISCVLMPAQVSVIHDWKSIGMRYSATNTFTAESQFVPFRFVFGLAEQKCLHEVPVFRFPFAAYAQAFFLSVQYGLLSRMLHEASVLVTKNEARWKIQHAARPNTVRSAVFFGMQMCLNFHAELQQLIEQIEKTEGAERDVLVTELDSAAKKQNAEMLRKAQQLFGLLGMDVLYEDHPVNSALRDMITCGQHYLMNDYGNAER
jgi:alkylation response protein AidB-like acyl-CoA dehydrogenase